MKILHLQIVIIWEEFNERRVSKGVRSVQFSSVQSLSRVWLFATPWITARQASLSITNSRSSLRLTVQPLWRTIWRLLKTLKTGLPYFPAVPLLGICPEKNMIWRDTCTPVFIAALCTVARMRKQPKCPSTEECIKKLWCMYPVGCYSAIKRMK